MAPLWRPRLPTISDIAPQAVSSATTTRDQDALLARPADSGRGLGRCGCRLGIVACSDPGRRVCWARCRQAGGPVRWENSRAGEGLLRVLRRAGGCWLIGWPTQCLSMVGHAIIGRIRHSFTEGRGSGGPVAGYRRGGYRREPGPGQGDGGWPEGMRRDRVCHRPVDGGAAWAAAGHCGADCCGGDGGGHGRRRGR